MGERKVVAHYFPPDFDPANVPKRNANKHDGKADAQTKIRFMLPFTVRCETCGNFLHSGTKFNCRKEDAPEHKYLDVMVYRFYVRCTRCAAEFTLRTDPKNADYVAEKGAHRAHDPSARGKVRADADDGDDAADDEPPDAMAKAEERAEETKREMDNLNALEDLRSINARARKVTADMALRAMHGEGTVAADDDSAANVANAVHPDDERALRAMLAKQRANVRRLENTDGDDGVLAKKRARTDEAPRHKPAAAPRAKVVAVRAKPAAAPPPPAEPPASGALAALAAYGSDSD